MYEWCSDPGAGLAASDVAAVQAFYGAREPDALEGGGGNNTPAAATPISLLNSLVNLNTLTLAQTRIEADIQSAADADYYKFTTRPCRPPPGL